MVCQYQKLAVNFWEGQAGVTVTSNTQYTEYTEVDKVWRRVISGIKCTAYGTNVLKNALF